MFACLLLALTKLLRRFQIISCRLRTGCDAYVISYASAGPLSNDRLSFVFSFAFSVQLRRALQLLRL